MHNIVALAADHHDSEMFPIGFPLNALRFRSNVMLREGFLVVTNGAPAGFHKKRLNLSRALSCAGTPRIVAGLWRKHCDLGSRSNPTFHLLMYSSNIHRCEWLASSVLRAIRIATSLAAWDMVVMAVMFL